MIYNLLAVFLQHKLHDKTCFCKKITLVRTENVRAAAFTFQSREKKGKKIKLSISYVIFVLII